MAKRKPQEEHHEEHADETWLIPYSDLLTLLLALFIVLFATSSLDKKKAAMFEYAISSAFSGDPVSSVSAQIVGLIDEIGGLQLGENVGLGSDSQGAVIDIANVSMFKPGSVEINKDGMLILEKISQLLNQPKYARFSIIVEGHTDDTQEAMDSYYPSNWELSASRAGSVVRQMIAFKVDPTRLKAVGMADIAPAYPNRDVYGQPIPYNAKKNRRVVIKIVP